jgi:DNA-binding NtrC family response regulator
MFKIKILIVDDEEDFRDTLINRLTKREIDASGAESGEKALELVRKFDYDVIILDIRMPGMDGIETLRQVKSIKPLVEVILLTGHATIESGVEGMRLGAFDYVIKPADIDSLMEKINLAYDKKALHDKKIYEATIRDITKSKFI